MAEDRIMEHVDAASTSSETYDARHTPRRSLLIPPSEESRRDPHPSTTTTKFLCFVSFRSFAAMHACLGIIHPNPLQLLLLPVCLSLSLLRLIYLPFPSLSPLKPSGRFLRC